MCGQWAGMVVAGVMLSAAATLAGIFVAGRITHAGR